MSKLDYEEWYDENIQEILIELAEKGSYYELDFDEEIEVTNRYEKYLTEN